MTDNTWLHCPMGETFTNVAAEEAEKFREQLQLIADNVLELGGTPNDTFSIYGFLLAQGLDHMVDEMRCRAASLPSAKGRVISVEDAVQIIVHDTMMRFWIAHPKA